MTYWPCLSVRQPWAWLIVNGYKDVENRLRQVYFRGRIFIHASKNFDEEGAAVICGRHSWVVPRLPAKYEMGGLIGSALLVDCTTKNTGSEWFEGPYGLILRDSRPMPYVGCSGRLGLFKVEVAEALF